MSTLKNPYSYKYGYSIGGSIVSEVSSSGEGLKIMRSTDNGKTFKQLGNTLKFDSNAPSPTPTPTPVPISNINKPTIAIINACTVLTDDQIGQYTKDFQTALDRDFTPIWGVTANLQFIGKGQTPPAGSWWLSFLDNSDVADALGYHDITSEGLPLGKAFAKTDLDNGYDPAVTSTHELWEMLIDPWINLVAQIQKSDGNLRDYAYEVADPCEADMYGYKVGNTVISDFVTPAWFEPFRKTGPFDYQKKITKPFQLLKGGYLQYIDFNSSQGWQQQFADSIKAGQGAYNNTFKYSQIGAKGSRRERRIRGKLNWLKSSVNFK